MSAAAVLFVFAVKLVAGVVVVLLVIAGMGAVAAAGWSYLEWRRARQEQIERAELQRRLGAS